MISIEQVYDVVKGSKDYKIFVDRLWPRGISRENAPWDEWMKEVAPGNELRKWFNHEPRKWDKFRQRYKEELEQKQELVSSLKNLEILKGNITLLYSARDKQFNNANALREILRSM